MDLDLYQGGTVFWRALQQAFCDDFELNFFHFTSSIVNISFLNVRMGAEIALFTPISTQIYKKVSIRTKWKFEVNFLMSQKVTQQIIKIFSTALMTKKLWSIFFFISLYTEILQPSFKSPLWVNKISRQVNILTVSYTIESSLER
jgi:hypothetical protein